MTGAAKRRHDRRKSHGAPDALSDPLAPFNETAKIIWRQDMARHFASTDQAIADILGYARQAVNSYRNCAAYKFQKEQALKKSMDIIEEAEASIMRKLVAMVDDPDRKVALGAARTLLESTLEAKKRRATHRFDEELMKQQSNVVAPEIRRRTVWGGAPPKEEDK